MKKKFESLNGLGLIVKNRKSAIIFEMEEDCKGEYKFKFDFAPKTFKALLEYIELIAGQSWDNVIPKEIHSMGSDYYEYYDRELDNNGYLELSKNLILIEKPSICSNKLYQFNKNKIESFIYNFRKLI